MRADDFRSLFDRAHILSLLIILSAAAPSVRAENFRVRKVIPVALSEINEKITVESGINDALFVTLPDDLTYVSGVELNFKIPEVVATWRDSVAYMFYESLSPAPTESQQNYSGERVHLSTFPGKLSLVLYAPVSDDFSIKSSPYSVKLPQVKNYKDGIFLRFMMVMKGVPESLESSVFEITAKPVLKNQGALSLSVSPVSTEEKKYSVFIDDAPVQDYKNKILPTGEHHLSVVSDSYRNELRTFRVEQAKTTTLAVSLRGIEPLLKILAPRNASVFLDGSQITVGTEPLAVTQGEHAVRIVIGDYEITKTVSAQNGRTYAVNLNVDATVYEED